MKAFLGITAIVILIVALAYNFGWFTFSQTDHTATVNVHKEEVKDDTKKAVRKVKSLSEKAIDKGKSTIEDLQKKDEDSEKDANEGQPKSAEDKSKK